MNKTAFSLFPKAKYTDIDLNNAIVIELNKLFLELLWDETTDDKTLEIVAQQIHSIGRRITLHKCCSPNKANQPSTSLAAKLNRFRHTQLSYLGSQGQS